MSHQMRGEIEYVLRNAETLEEEGRNTVSNLVLPASLSLLNRYAWLYAPYGIMLSTGPISAGYFETQVMSQTGEGFIYPDSAIPNVNTKLVIAPSATDDMVLQASGRFLQPANRRWIYNISVTTYGVATSNNYSLAASSRLAVPCIQETNQVLDVYYRIYIVGTAGKNGSWIANSEVDPTVWALNNCFQYTTNSTEVEYMSYLNIYPYPLDDVRSRGWIIPSGVYLMEKWGGFRQTNRWNLYNWRGNKSATVNGVGSMTISTDRNDYAGQPYHYQAGALSPLRFGLSLAAVSPGRTIQTIFGKSGRGRIYMEDVDNLMVGGGKLKISGSWAWNGAANGTRYQDASFPFTIRARCIKTGKIGTAEYRIQKVPFTNQLVAQLNGSSSNAPFPQLSRPNSSGSTITWKNMGPIASKEFVPERHAQSMGTYGESGVFFVTEDKLWVFGTVNGRVWDYPLATLNPGQSAVVDDTILISDRDAGVYAINPKTEDTVRKIAGIARCYGIAKGSVAGTAVVLTDVGMRILTVATGVLGPIYNATSATGKVLFLDDLPYIRGIKVNHYRPGNKTWVFRTAITSMPNVNTAGYWWSENTNSVPITGMYGASSNENWRTYNDSGGVTRYVYLHLERTFGDNINPSPYSDRWIISPCNNNTTYNSSMLRRLVKIDFNSPEPSARGTLDGPGTAANWTTTGEVMQGRPMSLAATAIKFFIDKDGIESFLYPWIGIQYNTGSNYLPAWQFMTFNLENMAIKYMSNITVGGVGTEYASNGYYGDGNACGVANGSEHNQAYSAPVGSFGVGMERIARFPDGTFMHMYQHYQLGITVQRITAGTSARVNMPLEVEQQTSDTYGWDGTKWVLGLETGRPFHTTMEDFCPGVKIGFDNSDVVTAPNSWYEGDYYQTIMYNGFVKDNATTATLNVVVQFVPGEMALTDLEAYVVPAPAVRGTGLPAPSLRNTSNSSITFDGSGNAVFRDPNPQQCAGYDAVLAGDWKMQAAASSVKTLAAGTSGILAGGFANVCSMVGGISYSLAAAVLAPQTRREWANNYPWYGDLTYTFPTNTVGNTVGIENKYASAQMVFTADTASNTITTNGSGFFLMQPLVKVVPTGLANYGSRGRYPAPNNIGPGVPITVARPQIIVNNAFCGIRVGDPVRKTGVFHDDYGWVNPETELSATLNGTPAKVILDGDGAFPVQGEIMLNYLLGYLVFNPADQGKAVTFKCNTVFK